jgi:AcrR family transcriptional regulator
VNRIDRRKREISDRILRAAFDLFLDRGVAATTIEDICQRADIANRTFFNHFPTRQAMVTALATRLLTDMREFEVTRVDEPVPARIIGMFDDIAAALMKSTESYREIISELMAGAGHGTHHGLGLHDMFVEMVKGASRAARSRHAMTHRSSPTSPFLRCRARSGTGPVTRLTRWTPSCTTPRVPWPTC